MYLNGLNFPHIIVFETGVVNPRILTNVKTLFLCNEWQKCKTNKQANVKSINCETSLEPWEQCLIAGVVINL